MPYVVSMKAPRRKASDVVASPIPAPVVVVPPPPTAEVLGTKPEAGKQAGSKRKVAPREHPGSRTIAGKASRTEIRTEVKRRVPSRLSPQQAKHTGVAPGSRAAKPKRSK